MMGMTKKSSFDSLDIEIVISTQYFSILVQGLGTSHWYKLARGCTRGGSL